MDLLTPRRILGACTLMLAFASFPAGAAEPPVKLAVKPLLCVLDKDATSCTMTFDIRWKSLIAGEFCLNDTLAAEPRMCWGSGQTAGSTRERREVSEEFMYWLGVPAGTERLSEVKISVLRVGSTDRRRERRTRHVWDVL
jgi:hypothetical protein